MYNFVNEAASIRTSSLCYYDTVNGYFSDFSTNGNVSGYDYWDGIHTYGCSSGFLFGTLYGSYALIGRTSIFYPVPAENYYFVKITMKINPTTRVGSQVLPTTARLMWITTSDSSWNTTKSYDFDIETDNEWHTYILNMGELQYWQGDITSLRLYPILADGRSGDEFFIKSIKITSIDTYRCDNTNCSYYSSYTHPCPGIGTKGYCKSSSNSTTRYTIEEGVNDEFIININGYGNETIKLDAISNATGEKIAKLLTTKISTIGIGGYAEVEIGYTDDNEFIIYSGTYTTDSTVVVGNSSGARLLGFFSDVGVDLSSKTAGTLPATGAESASSFKIKSFQTLTLFDNDQDTFFYFDPAMYNVEGGRRDWIKGGLGVSNVSIGTGQYTSAANTSARNYDLIDNAGKTIIDFNHPFNSSGRIKKIYAACTLDQGYASVSSNPPATSYEGRIEATGCKILILRPKRNGNLEVVDSVDIPDRNYSSSRLYSYIQESIDLDCDVWVNKGDLIGIYNANMYAGKSISGDQIDALYYQINGQASGEFDPGDLYGDGISGLLMYARSDKTQDKLVLDVDLGDRVNIEDINILGSVENISLEYNIARCLDVNWSVDLFGGQHQTGYINGRLGLDHGHTYTYEHENVAYGLDKLSDGVTIVPDGYSASGYTVGDESVAGAQSPNLTSTFVVTNPQYFFVNGDQEWLGIYQHKRSSYASNAFVQGFNEDPIAFTLLFPYGRNKSIYKSVIYFKEKWNFRNFSLAVTYNLNAVDGDADDVRFNYIPEYTAVTIDNQKIELDGRGYDSVEKYLFVNPCQGEPIFEFSGLRGPSGEYLGEITNYEEYTQASNLDWTYLSHEFEPIECKGFRFYCDYHYSTKITEMELYCRVDDLGSNMVGGMSVSYSYYEDLWWQASLDQDSNTSVTADIKDTPRYFRIEIEPITKMTLSEIRFNVKNDELYIGEKGCEYQVLPIESKTNTINAPQITYIKNIYNSQYDLYVDIADDEEVEDRLIFHTKLNSEASIINPEIGPDATYHKTEDYPLVGHYKNCAINNDCWGLKNLIDGKKAYYSNDDGYTWHDFKTLASGVDVNFSNITVSNFSVVNFPIYYRSRYWKIGWICENHSAMNVREMRCFYDDTEVVADFYHDKELPFAVGPITDTAPHLNNNSVTGSYYKLQGGSNIGVDLGTSEVINKFIWFNDSITDYDQSYCGIDKYTELNITIKDGNIVDYSYDERSGITTVGSGISIGTGKFDFDENEITPVNGLYGASDTNPTTATLALRPDLVDGILYNSDYAGSGNATMNKEKSVGVDLGAPTEISKLRFYASSDLNQVTGINGWYSWLTFYVYKSDDNVNWTLAESWDNQYTYPSNDYTIRPPLLNDKSVNHAWFQLTFSKNHTARYFKLWAATYYHWSVSGSVTYTGPWITEIKVYAQITNSNKTGINFSGYKDSYLSVPASNNFAFPGVLSSTAQPFTIDFYFKVNSLPEDYCTLIRSWPDIVETASLGDVQYPPSNVEHYGRQVGGFSSPQPTSNWAIFLRSSYNLGRTPGATYYASGSYTLGSPQQAFDDRGNTYIGWTSPVPVTIQCNLPTAKKVVRYGVYSDSTSYALKSWQLQGYIGGTWLDLHAVSNHSFTPRQVDYWDFTNPYAACNSYRLYITATMHTPYTRVSSIQLFDEGGEIVIADVESWFQSKTWAGAGYYWFREYRDFAAPVLSGSTHYFNVTRYPAATALYSIQDGYTNWSIQQQPDGLNSSSPDLKIGDGLDGFMADIRITKGIDRKDHHECLWYPHERYYTMSIYTSDDNIVYGKYCDIDLYKENSYSLHSSGDQFSSNYYSQLAIDLENRYDLELIRSYGNSDTQPFSIWAENSTDIYYSNDDVDNISEVTWTTRDSYTTKTLWTSEYCVSVNCPSVPIIYRSFTAVNCAGLTKENGFLKIDLQCKYYSASLDIYAGGKIQISSSGGVSSKTWEYILTTVDLVILLDGEYHTFYLPFNNFNTVDGELDVSNINYVRMYYYCNTGGNYLYICWKNAYVVYGEAELNVIANDARWLRFDLLSGDGTSRIIRKLGIYPDVSTQLSPGGGYYNHEWDYLGKSITAYESSANLALGTAVSGSSYFGMTRLDYLTDGIINKSTGSASSAEDSSLYNVWGSENESNPWISVDLGAIYSVYRFKIYHGYDDSDTDYLITDYSVQTSTDGQIYTTRFSISDNSSFERTHDLTVPVQARYIKVVITGYNSKRILLKVDLEGTTLEFFEGAVMREIQVFEYYGYPVISSEDYPVVAINLNDQFYLSSHSIVGIDTEDSSTNWVNQNYNFCYNDSVLNNPSKVDFGEWGEDPCYDRWAVVKMDTATNHNGGPSYLKHVRIVSSEDQNPCNYPWWWQSTISTISSDYNYEVQNSISSLKIEYPATTAIDEVLFIEGDHFGTDTLASWRDGFNFRFRIDNVDNLDRSYGYFYLGGYDASSGENPITYKWYLSTLSGSLTSGWNDLFLRFKAADEISYTETYETDYDLRIVRTINLAKIGMVYKGVGNELTMHLDGFKIERNRFYDYSAHDVGAYFNNNDYLTAPIGEYDMSKGTIEFWMRPDYDYTARDYYGVMHNRAIFSFNNNVNDVFGLTVGYNGLEVYFGNTGQVLNVFSLGDLEVDILDVMFHVGVVFSNDGTQIDIDGSTFRLYFNNVLVFKAADTWEVLDNKHFTFILGGTAPLNLKAGTYIETSSIDSVLSDFKIYNYCKTDFYNSMRNKPDLADKIIKPSSFIEISKNENNLTYYKVGDVDLPLVYKNVPPGVSVPVYVRTNIPKGLTAKENRTAGLLIYFDISV